MKNKFLLLLTAASLIVFAACNKVPKDVVISADKTTAQLGDTIKFSVTAGDFRSMSSATPWVDVYIKKPGDADFTKTMGTRLSEKPYQNDLIWYSIDTTYAVGTYTFYAKVRNCNDTEDDGNKRIANSNEIAVTVTP